MGLIVMILRPCKCRLPARNGMQAATVCKTLGLPCLLAAIIPAMKSGPTKVLASLFLLLVVARLEAADEPQLSPMPAPVSNNAVAISHDAGGDRIYSFM